MAVIIMRLRSNRIYESEKNSDKQPETPTTTSATPTQTQRTTSRPQNHQPKTSSRSRKSTRMWQHPTNHPAFH